MFDFHFQIFKSSHLQIDYSAHYLVRHKILEQPTLYLSDFFERNKELYYQNLTVVRTQNNLTQWIKFFWLPSLKLQKRGQQPSKMFLNWREKLRSIKCNTWKKTSVDKKIDFFSLQKSDYYRIGCRGSIKSFQADCSFNY